MTDHVSIVRSDGPVAIERADTWRWFVASFLKAAAETGAWAKLSPSACKLLIAMAVHADGTGRFFVGAARLRRLTGFARSTIFSSLRELTDAKLLSVETRGGGQRANRYALARGEQSDAGWVVRPAGLVRHAGLPTPSATPDRCSPPRRTGVVRHAGPQGATEKAKQQGGAAAAVRFALVEAGIGEPTQSELAALEGITPELVQSVAAQVRARGKGPGVLVNELRAEVDRERARAAEANRKALVERERRAEAERLRADDERKAAADRERIAKTRAILEGMTETERAQVIRESMAHLSHRSRRDPLQVDWAALEVADYLAKRLEVMTCGR